MAGAFKHEELAEFMRPRAPANALEIVNKRVDAYKRKTAYQPPFRCPSMYDSVFVTSDLHADLWRFIVTLYSAGIISYPDWVVDDEDEGEDEDSPRNAFEDMLHNMAFTPEVFTEVKWTAGPRTLLVIVGDLVDGRRDPRSVFDPVGNIELLLHIFLFNLRILAQECDSDVVFTIGNHDHHMIITNDFKYMMPYVHKTALKYFTAEVTYFNAAVSYLTARNAEPDGSRGVHAALKYRAEVLFPFYTINPYYALEFGDEALFVHAGFLHGSGSLAAMRQREPTGLFQHGASGSSSSSGVERYLLSKVKAAARSLFAEGFPQDPEGPLFNPATPSGSALYHMIWTRVYATELSHDAAATCALLKDYSKRLLVLGHCITSQMLGETLEHHAHYKGCFPSTEKSCIVLACPQKDDAADADHTVSSSNSNSSNPRLALVDAGSAFQNSAYETHIANLESAKEILVLHRSKRSVSFYATRVTVQYGEKPKAAERAGAGSRAIQKQRRDAFFL